MQGVNGVAGGVAVAAVVVILVLVPHLAKHPEKDKEEHPDEDEDDDDDEEEDFSKRFWGGFDLRKICKFWSAMHVEALIHHLSCLDLCWHRTPPAIRQLQGAHSELLSEEASWSLLAPDSTRNWTTSRCPF